MAPNDNHNPHYDTHRYAGDQAADTRRVMNHMPDEDRSTTQEIQQSINSSQAAELAPEVRMGDDRVLGGGIPNWDSFESEQLYQFALEGNSPTTADDLGRAFNTGGNSLVEAANGLFAAVSQLDGAWTGVAADSARSALKPLAQAAGLAGQTAQMMGVQMSAQSVAATEVKKLPPPQQFDKQQSLNAMMAGGPAAMQADLKTQKDAADAVKREQISYLNTYTSSMSAVDAQTPSFVPPQETIGGGGGNTNNISGERVNIPSTGSGAPVIRGGTSAGPGSKYTGVAGPGGAAAPGVGGDDGGQTDQSSFAPLPSTATSGYNPTPSTSTFGPLGGGGPTAGGPTAGGGPGAGAGGFGGGFGNFGGGGAAGGGPGSSGGSGTPGGRPGGAGPGGFGPNGGRGAGPGGGGGAPRGKGEKEEDQEHQRPSYLVEGDPESTFGNDALTAPPVIGSDD